MTEEQLKKECKKIEESMKNCSKTVVCAELISFVLSNADICLNEKDIFLDHIECDLLMNSFLISWLDKIKGEHFQDLFVHTKPAEENAIYVAESDWGHTVPDWDNIMTLGIPGLLERIRTARQRGNLTEEQVEFYTSCEKAYVAMLGFMERLAKTAIEKGTDEQKLSAQWLLNLTERPPKTLPEAMELTIIYYMFQMKLDGIILRSLGQLDELYNRFYLDDIKSGRYTDEELREYVRRFLIHMSDKRVNANMPFCLGRTTFDGEYITNEMTYIILEEYIALDIYDPKIHIRYSENIPDRLIRLVTNSIRDGKNSFVFINDRVAYDALMGIGISKEDAVKYVPVGCYEPTATGKEVSCTCNGRMNIPKAVITAMFQGRGAGNDIMFGVDCGAEFKTFEEFYNAVKEQLKFFISKMTEQISRYEKYYPEFTPSIIYSATMDEPIEKGVDAYFGGAKYNNSSICAFGIGTATDALMAIKKLVFEDKKVSFSQMREAIANNWQGYEKLRLHALRCPKYGNGDKEADNLSVDLCDFLADNINNKPNGRGGVFRFGMISIDWCYTFGKDTEATPDGRFAGEPLSKNTSATTGMDNNGVTALINSVSKIDYTKFPNGTVLDLILHSSATRGESGLLAMIGLIRKYMTDGGFAVHINVMDANVLRSAQLKPEDYPTLQVRVCGWNAYFVDLSKKEQDDFIIKAEQSEGA